MNKDQFKSLVSNVISFILGVAGLYLSLYFKKPNLELTVTQNINVLDIKDKVFGVKVLLNEVNLIEDKKELRTLIFRLKNEGYEKLEKESFGIQDLPRLNFSNAKILDAKIVKTSSKYLTNNLLFHVSGSALEFDPFILEPSEYFYIKLLLITDTERELEMRTSGSIVGIDFEKISIVDVTKERKNLWSEAISGSLNVQLLRTLVYFIIFILAFGSIALIVGGFSGVVTSRLGRNKRKRILNKFLNKYKLDSISTALWGKIFVREDYRKISKFQFFLLNEKAIHALANKSIFEKIQAPADFSFRLISVSDQLSKPSYYDNQRSYGNFIDAVEVATELQAILQIADLNKEKFQNEIDLFLKFLIDSGEQSEEEIKFPALKIQSVLKRYRNQLNIASKKETSNIDVPIGEELIQKVNSLLPAQPWPQGTHRIVTEKLGISQKTYNKVVQILISRGEWVKQENGILYPKKSEVKSSE